VRSGWRLARGFLGKQAARGRHKHNRGLLRRRYFCFGISHTAFQEFFDRFKQRLRFQHHTFAAAEWAVVDGAMAILGELAQILNMNLRDAGFARAANNAVIERPGEKFREDSDEVEAHRFAV